MYVYDISKGVESIGEPIKVFRDLFSSSVTITSVVWSPLNKHIILG